MNWKMISRLKKANWEHSLTISTHLLFYKKDWQCSINRDTGKVIFRRVMKIDTVELMRGPVEEGID